MRSLLCAVIARSDTTKATCAFTEVNAQVATHNYKESNMSIGRQTLALLLALWSCCAFRAVADAAADTEAILGKWQVVTAYYGEKETKVASVWSFTKTHIEYPSGAKDPYTLAHKESPAHISLTVEREQFPKEILIGIYELKGDELKISITESVNARPKQFAKGRDHNYFILNRVKEKK